MFISINLLPVMIILRSFSAKQMHVGSPTAAEIK